MGGRAGWRVAGVLAVFLAAGFPSAGAAARTPPEMPPQPLPPGIAVTPLTGPVTIGGEAWGPFRRACFGTRLSGGVHGPGGEVLTRCLRFAGVRPAPGGARVTAVREDVPDEPRPRFGRSEAGVISGWTLLAPNGAAPPPGNDDAAGGWEENLRALALPPGRLAPGEVVRMPDATGWWVGGRLPMGEVPCTAEGTARHRGRPLVVLRCEHRVARDGVEGRGGSDRCGSPSGPSSS